MRDVFWVGRSEIPGLPGRWKSPALDARFVDR